MPVPGDAPSIRSSCAQWTERDEPLGVVLACDTCQHVWEPTLQDFGTGNTGCPLCGGWTWIVELAEPDPIPAPRSPAASRAAETPHAASNASTAGEETRP